LSRLRDLFHSLLEFTLITTRVIQASIRISDMCSMKQSDAWAPSAILIAVLLASLVPLLTGCGGKTGPVRAAVEGTVTLDGRGLAAGVIRFVPAEGNSGPAAGTVIKDGAYKLAEGEGPIIGRQRVEIEATDHLGFEADDERAYATAVTERKGKPLPKNPVPDRYNRQSTLEADIKADDPNKYDFALTSDGKK